MMDRSVLIAIFSGVLSAFSQVLLKKSSMIKKSNKIEEYINAYVIAGYGIMLLCMVLMVVALKGMPLKYAAVIESLGYFYIMVLGRIFLGEKITLKRLMGNLAIVGGIIVFSIK